MKIKDKRTRRVLCRSIRTWRAINVARRATMQTSVPMETMMTRHRLDQVPALDWVASMMLSHYLKQEAWSHRSVLDKHENPRNREPGCIYTIEYWIRLNMWIVRVTHFSLITNVERQLCIVNRGYAIVTKQQWGDRTNKFRSTFISQPWNNCTKLSLSMDPSWYSLNLAYLSWFCCFTTKTKTVHFAWITLCSLQLTPLV
jgi:hypothetical protein